MKTLRLFVVWMVFAGLLEGCADRPTPEPVTYAIDMKEFAFEPAVLQLKVGQLVTLDLTNSGQLPHEIMIGREVMLMDNKPAGYQDDLFEMDGADPKIAVLEEGREVEGVHSGDDHSGFMAVVNPGGNSTLTFTVTEEMAGEWEMGCFEQDGVHYTAGMKGPVTVSQ